MSLHEIHTRKTWHGAEVNAFFEEDICDDGVQGCRARYECKSALKILMSILCAGQMLVIFK